MIYPEPVEDTYYPFWFPLSQRAWERYQVNDLMTAEAAAAITRLVYALRKFADRLNAKRDSHTYAMPAVHAGQLVGVGLLTEILRYVADKYCIEDCAGAMDRGLEAARAERGAAGVDYPLQAFAHLYPPTAVREKAESLADFLAGATHGQPNRLTISREMALLYVTMANPALEPFQELYDDAELRRDAPYEPFVGSLERFFASQPPFAGYSQTLFEMLRAPARACPDSLEGQLRYIRENWASFLPARLLEWLLLAEGIMKEEARLRGHGPGPAEVLRFGRQYLNELGDLELEAFTHDKDWMANVVLIAKTAYVWLDQLSRKYQRPITRLDQIPDEALHCLARWGFTGLWLIGVWERSPASQKIKQLTGNPEALASAYSLYDYTIASDLGGEEAYQALRERAWRCGIRLASDMVPNHVGLYSRWVIEHPDWFLQLDYPPYPCYRFNGADLSWDERVGLFIEDGYWDNRDAAVTFKRLDRWTGSVRYIYHGNDGTNMPWNDTAQLNFLIPEVREAVIQTILHVARRFPIIRFDAAMTLAKRHYQRLWFPRPGEGGAIPSRAEHGMTKEEFDRAFPKEFWREVVDRIQAEAPDTLLLAEAFWLMEGYFVRTLGMHRVYNSAFMNMLKMEENANYRQTVKNVLEFSPQVIKRFVNFMNNPDERTAVDQFGKGDKYFGVAVLMVTMPGLPMFGHGQIEGFTEKYGMEYHRAYWDEQVDEHMVSRHETEVFPLMRKRRLFSGADNFAFYDARVPEGWVDENVFAYSNRDENERAIILFNNAYTTSRGRIHTSTAINAGDTDHKNLVFRTLSQALALNTSDDCYYVFRDHRTQIEYLRHAPELAREGLAFELHAYEYNAFLDWREVYDYDNDWGRLNAFLGGKGVRSVDEAYRELKLEPILAPFREVMSADMLQALAGARDAKTTTRFKTAMSAFLSAVAQYTHTEVDVNGLTRQCLSAFEAAAAAPNLIGEICPKDSPFGAAANEMLDPTENPPRRARAWCIPLSFIIAQHALRTRAQDPATHAAVMDEWMLTRTVSTAFADLGMDESAANSEALLVRILVAYHSPIDLPAKDKAEAFRAMFEDIFVQRYLRMNIHEGVLWLNKERMEQLVFWFLFATCLNLGPEPHPKRGSLVASYSAARAILNAVDAAGYQAGRLIELLEQSS